MRIRPGQGAELSGAPGLEAARLVVADAPGAGGEYGFLDRLGVLHGDEEGQLVHDQPSCRKNSARAVNFLLTRCTNNLSRTIVMPLMNCPRAGIRGARP